MSTDTITTNNSEHIGGEFRIPDADAPATESLHPELKVLDGDDRKVSDARLAVSDAYAAQEDRVETEQPTGEIDPAAAAKFVAAHGRNLRALRAHHTNHRG